MKAWTLFAMILLSTATAFGAMPSDILGSWKTAGDRSELEIFRCGENRPIIGLQVIEGLAVAGENRWENGACYDPESGNSYKCKIRLASPDRLEVRGFIGFSLFGRTYVLTRKEMIASTGRSDTH